MDLHHLLLAGLPAHSGLPLSRDIFRVRRHLKRANRGRTPFTLRCVTAWDLLAASAGIEGGRYEPRAVNSGRQSSLRSGASRSACRAPRLSHYGVAALADAEGAVAQSHQYHPYFLSFGRPHEAVLAGPERGNESESRRNPCSWGSATSSSDQRWHQVAHVPGSTRYRRIRLCSSHIELASRRRTYARTGIASEDWRQSCSILLKLSSRHLSGSLKTGTAKSMESSIPPIRTSLVLSGASR